MESTLICVLLLLNTYINSGHSEDDDALPTASVKIVNPQSLLYPGETVTLQCDISDYTDWTYRWFRDNHHLPSQTSKAIDITIPITQTGQAGQYRCEGLRTDRPQRSQPIVVVTISVTALPNSTLTVKPNPAFTGEKVTLKCSVTYDSSWNYQWYKDWNFNVVPQSVSHTITGDTLTISRAAESDQGQYWCEGNRVSRPTSSQPGDPVTLTVEGLPKATLTVEPNPVFPGETVTLTCSVESDSIWSYKWYKDRNDNVVSQSGRHTITGDTLTINGATVNEGPYWCQGERDSRPTSSSISDPVTITVNALPVASVSVSSQGLLYSGETVSLQCVIPGYTDWRYYWYKNNQHLPDETSKVIYITIPITQTGQAGQYWCEGNRVSRPTSSLPSDPVTLTVKALPTALVKIVTPQGLLYPGETVTLRCDISDYTDWTYRWFRNNEEPPIQTRKTITISLPDQAGKYQCFGTRRDRPQKSYRSSALPIIITDYQPKTTLTSDKENIFTGDRVTLSCTVESPGWKFYWYRHRPDSTPVTTTSGYSYTLSWVSVSDGGQYWCRAGRGDPVYYTLYSDPVQINITDQPQPVLSISSQWLNPGDSVTLSCEVDKTSIVWRFSWYRTVPYRAGLPSLSDKSYSLQPLSDNVTSEDSYTQIPAGPTPTGGYVCRAGRGDPVYDTFYSEPQFLWSGDLQPSASLTVNPNTTQHFTSKSLSLICELKGNSTGWRLKRHTETARRSECPSTWRSITESTCTITSLTTWHSGVFWCESGSGENSNAVNITVNDGDVILESPVHPVTEGDSVTLTCTFRHQGTNPKLKTDFYKDGTLIKNETTGEMTIPIVSKSDEGFYKCKSDEGESPESWVTVRVSPVVSPGSSTSVLVLVVVGLLVAGVLLVILLVLLVRYQNRKGETFEMYHLILLCLG
uniref:Ig-like domain-containing protein n=1 Tax=Oncorhynchus kisutch TaxID=8019 RepID=A0A8C7J448_ONCKI